MKEPKYQKAKDLLKVSRLDKHPLYFLWYNMISRCHNVKGKGYEYYGDKGVYVCKRWREDYAMGLVNFCIDMGERPSKLHSVDRINPKEGYYPENCRWVLPEIQSRNKNINKSNTSGYTGVSYEDGKYCRWLAFWCDLDGKIRRKSFSVNKYGYDEALQLAINYRDKMIKKLNEQGAGYSEHHGK